MANIAGTIFVGLSLLVASILPSQAGPALLYEPLSGKVLYSEDMDQLWHPASLTKMMTAYIVFQDIRAGKLTLKSKIHNSKSAQAEPPSKLGLPLKATLILNTALKALIVKSANDVAVMLAEAVGGTKEAFVARMNATAKRLGMSRTHYVNPNGLPDKGQITTARDLARLTRAIIKEFPEYAHYWKTKSFRLGKRRLRSHNGLLRRFDGADGMKTGFICDSGFNVVASATRGGRRLIAIVLGEPSGKERTIRASSILEYGFRQYFWKTYFNSSTIDNMPVNNNAGPVKSVRQTVTAYSCGNRPSMRRKQRAKLKARAARRARLRAARRSQQLTQAAKGAGNQAAAAR